MFRTYKDHAALVLLTPLFFIVVCVLSIDRGGLAWIAFAEAVGGGSLLASINALLALCLVGALVKDKRLSLSFVVSAGFVATLFFSLEAWYHYQWQMGEAKNFVWVLRYVGTLEAAAMIFAYILVMHGLPHLPRLFNSNNIRPRTSR